MLNALCASCSDRTPSEEVVRSVRVIRVGDTAAFRGREFPGRAEALQHADLSFRVGGTLIMLPARIGARVEEGEVIARLDPRDFEVRVRGGEAALARAQSDLARAQEEFTRGTTAFERGGVSEIEMVRVREALNVARATVKAIDADLQAARDDLTDTSLRAPFSGEIAARFVENFEDVQARERVLRLLDNDRVKFTVFIPESMIGLLPLVRDIVCEFDALPGALLPAEVYEVGREADDVTRTFPVTLIMDQPKRGRILAGMTGRASVVGMEETSPGTNSFDLPPTAIAEGADGERFVWVIDESTGLVTRRVVTIEMISPAGLRVSGVRQGDVVATAGAAFLREGQRVRVMEPGVSRGSRG